MAMGARIKELREARGWSPTEFARITEIDQRILSALERRDSTWSVYAREIAAIFGVSLEALLYGNTMASPGDQQEATVVALYRRLDHDDQQALVRWLEGIVVRKATSKPALKRKAAKTK